MYEKVTPMHPDKIADRIAGALVDYAYSVEDNPRIAAEVLIGHGKCHIVNETSVTIPIDIVNGIVKRIAGDVEVDYAEYPQDKHLADNQDSGIRCGNNGIFMGAPITKEQFLLAELAYDLYEKYKSDGKYVVVDDGVNDKLIICQSGADWKEIKRKYTKAYINPLGDWTGGTNVDTGATNRKLGSDMGDAVTGGGLHGKDLSKADVSANIFCFFAAQQFQKPVKMSCAIGDTDIDGIPFEEIVSAAKDYIRLIGGFEKFAEWGLIRPQKEDLQIETKE